VSVGLQCPAISYVDTDNVQILEEMPMLDIPKTENIIQPY